MKSTPIKNAAIWTGARNGAEVVYGDIYSDKGSVKHMGYIPDSMHAKVDDAQVELVDLQGLWVTPGLVYHLRGAFDRNSAYGPVLPWLRSIDVFDTHDVGML